MSKARDLCMEKTQSGVPQGNSDYTIVSKSYQSKKVDYWKAEEGKTVKRMAIHKGNYLKACWGRG
jgi:hypothetical protein